MSEPQQPFSWRKLQPHEAALAHRVHLEAIADQAVGLVRPDQPDHFTAHTGQAGAIVGCFGQAGKMVAYGVLGTASATSAHMAALLGIAPADKARFAILDGVACLPEYRGYGLHRGSIQARLDQASELGRSLIGATVSPDNIVSLRGLLEAQFAVRNFAMLYGGLARLILLRDTRIVDPAWSLEKKIGAGNRAAHQAALAMGLSAYACSQTASGAWQLHYGYPAAAQLK
ncbi:MAG: hypothetical protein V4488_17595 [Pseudomonadota bacterium]